MDAGPRILVIGAAGQIGTNLIPALRARFGNEAVISGCHLAALHSDANLGPVEFFDAADEGAVRAVIEKHKVNSIYNLASVLSGEGETNPAKLWRSNVEAFKIVLDAAVEFDVSTVFWPSSIAVFGDHAPHMSTPQHTVLEPTTLYGVSKVFGEGLCHYYFIKYGLDVRSVRYPGLVATNRFTGGGTSDYSVEMLLSALAGNDYACFVRPDTRMPLMAMEDAIRAAIELMDRPAADISIRTSYNLAALSFTAGELETEIRRHRPGFRCTYTPDFRQAIADSWPDTVDDSCARADWGWKEQIDLRTLVSGTLSPG